MNKNKGLLLILSTAVISGLAVFVSKFGVSVVNPYVFTGWKNIIVAVLAIAWILAFRDWRALKTLAQKKWLMLILVGLIGGSIPEECSRHTLSHISSWAHISLLTTQLSIL